MEKSFEERVAEARAEVAAVSAQEANQVKLDNPEVLFIDPRDAASIEKTTGIIPGALNVGLDVLSAESDNALPGELADRTRSIIAACQGGPMGALAAYALKRRGYNNVHFIDGGTQAWLDAGFETVR
jgi:rhodanese-related sulfurtransferase